MLCKYLRTFDSLVHVGLVSLLDLANHFFSGGVYRGKGLARDGGMELVVDENLSKVISILSIQHPDKLKAAMTLLPLYS